MVISPIMPSIQRQNTLAFLACMNARDYHGLGNLVSENFTHTLLPASLGTPVRNKQQFLDFAKELEAIIERFNFQPPKEIIEAKDIVVVHLTSDGKTTAGKPYNNEYMIIVRFEGEKISSIKEFIDSKYTSPFLE